MNNAGTWRPPTHPDCNGVRLELGDRVRYIGNDPGARAMLDARQQSTGIVVRLSDHFDVVAMRPDSVARRLTGMHVRVQAISSFFEKIASAPRVNDEK